MTTAEFEQILLRGENLTVEFKSWIRAKDMRERISLAVDELVAFANAKGGTIYMGVEDDGTVTGCTGYDTQKIMESIYDRTRPALFTDIICTENRTGCWYYFQGDDFFWKALSAILRI